LLNKIENIVNESNLKLTTARKDILNILIKAKKPLCYEDIKDSISMDKATFYRNISKFEEENIINSFGSNDKKRYFEIKKKSHAHFICTTCNVVECISADVNLNLKDGYKVENILINGKCSSCSLT